MPGQWTPVIALADVRTNPCAVEVAGEQLAIFQDAGGAWHALLDRCPHRSAQLSRGQVMDDGTLRCPYHGWRFSGDGRCKRVPLNDLDEHALERIRATAIPARALAGAVWVYTGIEAPIPPALPASLEGPASQYGTYTLRYAEGGAVAYSEVTPMHRASPSGAGISNSCGGADRPVVVGRQHKCGPHFLERSAELHFDCCKPPF